MVVRISGMVTNGPMPHIWVMLIAVAWNSLIDRWNPPSDVDGVTDVTARLPLLVRKVS
jgi:hypothetical protein